jgi:hypothetical protein
MKKKSDQKTVTHILQFHSKEKFSLRKLDEFILCGLHPFVKSIVQFSNKRTKSLIH